MATLSEPIGDKGDPGTRERTVALGQFVAGIRRHLWLVMAVFLTIVITTMWYTIRLPRLYRATTSVRIQEVVSPIPGAGASVVRDYRVNPIQTEQQIIKSQSVAERVASRLGLQMAVTSPDHLRRSALLGDAPPQVDTLLESGNFTVRLGPQDYSLLSEDGKQLATAHYGLPVSIPGLSFTVPARPRIEQTEVKFRIIPLRAAVSQVRSGIRTEGLAETNIIQIGYTGTDPELVRQIADQVASAYADFSSEAKRSQARTRTTFIQQSLLEQQRELLAKQNALKEFKEREQLSDVGAEVEALTAMIQRFEGDRNAARLEQGVYLELMGKLSASDTTTEALRRLANTQAIANNQNINKLYDRWYDLLREREKLVAQDIGPGNTDLAALDRLIVQTKNDLRAASAHYLQALESRIASLDSEITKLRRETEKYPGLEAREARLLSDLRTVQAVYDQLQAEFQRARISESSEDGYVRVIDRASLPMSPVAPNRTRIFFTAALVGLLFGIGAALWLDNLDDSIRTPEELKEIANWAILGTIPSIAAGKKQQTSKLATHLDPRSPVAEAYRSLRTNLSFARAHRALRVMVLTSPGPADGKSTTVANLAITFAQQGQRTLIIDGDLRRAVLDKLFEVPRVPGATDVLTGQRKLSECVNETNIPNLFVLGSGPFPPNPSELLGSSAMRDLLRDASESFDVVLIDTPPLLAVTDAAVLSTMADGVVVVVRMGATARPALRRAVSQLEAVEGRLLGMVLNDVDMRRGGYYYSNYGYYYYYYHHEGDKNGHRHGVLSRIRKWVDPASARR